MIQDGLVFEIEKDSFDLFVCSAMVCDQNIIHLTIPLISRFHTQEKRTSKIPGGAGNRTQDLIHAKDALYQLSHAPIS